MLVEGSHKLVETALRTPHGSCRHLTVPTSWHASEEPLLQGWFATITVGHVPFRLIWREENFPSLCSQSTGRTTPCLESILPLMVGVSEQTLQLYIIGSIGWICGRLSRATSMTDRKSHAITSWPRQTLRISKGWYVTSLMPTVLRPSKDNLIQENPFNRIENMQAALRMLTEKNQG